MKNIYIIILAIVIASASRTKAQGELASLQYSVGFPLGDFKDKFISRESWRGISFDYRKLVNDDNVGVGIDISWNLFDEKKDYASYTDGTATLSGIQYRYCGALPMIATLDYYFQPHENVDPFIGIGIGTIYTHNDVDMGLYTVYQDAWHFAWKGEVGAIFKVSPDMGVILAVKYDAGPSTSDVGERTYLATNIGLVWGHF